MQTRHQFSRRNQPITCTCCGKRTLPSTSEYIDSQLCETCYNSAGEYNSHTDGHHSKPLEHYYGLKPSKCPEWCPQFNNVECMHEVKK